MTMTTQILSFTEAFPPAYKLTETLLEIDYKKHYNQFMDAIVNLCAFIAAIATVIYDTWMKYNMNERVLKGYNWTLEVAVPKIKTAAIATYNFSKDMRQVYEMLNSRGFIVL